MKASERVIKKGDYYELQTLEDLMIQQRIPKKQQIQNPTITTATNQNILTQLPSRSDAVKNYTLGISGKVKTDDYGLDDYQNSLEQLLKLPIKDQERLEIQKLLKQISSIKNSQELPLNTLPQQNKRLISKQAPKIMNLVGNFNIKKLEQGIKSIEDIKYIELSRLQNIVQVLLSQNKESQDKSDQGTIDPKIKQQIQSLYNSLSQLTCLNNLSGTINKITANETKYVQISKWVKKTQQINKVNKDILDELQNDQLILNKLQQNFKKNIQNVKQIVKKLSE